ncbi:MAG: hypothetical protein CSA81_13365, partial [Acidobacteria bacterium]
EVSIFFCKLFELSSHSPLSLAERSGQFKLHFWDRTPFGTLLGVKMELRRARVIRYVTSTLAVFALATVGMLGFSQPASAAVGVSVVEYCSTNYAGASPSAVLVSDDAYGWRCKLRWHIFWRHLGVDMHVACKQQHGTSSRAYLLNNDSSSPYNWRCT